LIVATPTGSTAYSYAAGGPVVSPAAEGMLITPASPLSGISRPLFLAPDESVRLELIEGNPAFEVDGPVDRHLSAGEVIEVTLRRDGDRAVLRVVDHGPGIPADHLEKVFEKFHRVEDPMTMKTGGTGLGLFIAQRLARAMGGDITLVSTVGAGCAFTFTLPIESGPD